MFSDMSMEVLIRSSTKPVDKRIDTLFWVVCLTVCALEKKVKYQSKNLILNIKYPTFYLVYITCFLAMFLKMNIFNQYMINNHRLLHEEGSKRW